MSINIVSITGNLTRDPELRATGSGSSVLSFGVAVNDRRKNQSTGEWEDVPNFVDCVAFGNRADSLSRLMTKGMKVAVSGKLRQSSWETKDGQRRSKLEVIADSVEFLSQRNKQTSGGYKPQETATGYGAPVAAAPHPAYSERQTVVAGSDVYDEDIPF